MAPPAALLWFRQDLRLADNPALAAARAHGTVLPVYILDDADRGPWRWGAAKRAWLHHSLRALDHALRARGSRLVLRRGPAQAAIERLIGETGANAVFWNRCYEPFAVARDEALKARLVARRVVARSFNAGLLAEPWDFASGGGNPYAIFTPFWKALRGRIGAEGMPASPRAPERLPAPPDWPDSDPIDAWALAPRDAAGGFPPSAAPGEAGARARLGGFIDRALGAYASMRDRPDRDGTSLLSPSLALGEIGPRQVWQAVAAAAAAQPGQSGAAESFLRELGWREFCQHLLFHFPELPRCNWRAAFDAFPWRDDPAGLKAWRDGMTGYPVVDAGMRQLRRTGWMHNRVRMIAASFLVKDLLVDWRHGQAWFWERLVDADLANNAAGWQWVAGSGADAAPYFRVFNPVLQGRKFDPGGDYVRRFVPELARLPDGLIHEPWTAPAEALEAAGIVLGRNYPRPIVDHAAARARALAAYRAMRGPRAED